jgi:hypothetical protein
MSTAVFSFDDQPPVDFNNTTAVDEDVSRTTPDPLKSSTMA